MNFIDVMLFAIAIGVTFWLGANAWEEWRGKALSEITLVFLSAGIFVSWLLFLSMFDAL